MNIKIIMKPNIRLVNSCVI